MLIPISPTTFEYNGELIDINQLKYEYRQVGRHIHKIVAALTALHIVSIELSQGLKVDESYIDKQLGRLHAIRTENKRMCS